MSCRSARYRAASRKRSQKCSTVPSPMVVAGSCSTPRNALATWAGLMDAAAPGAVAIAAPSHLAGGQRSWRPPGGGQILPRSRREAYVYGLSSYSPAGAGVLPEQKVGRAYTARTFSPGSRYREALLLLPLPPALLDLHQRKDSARLISMFYPSPRIRQFQRSGSAPTSAILSSGSHETVNFTLRRVVGLIDEPDALEANAKTEISENRLLHLLSNDLDREAANRLILAKDLPGQFVGP